MPRFAAWLRVGCLLLMLPVAAQAIEDRADIDPNDPLDPGEVVAWKLTAAVYRDSTAGGAGDLNLRGNTDELAFWFGSYRERTGFSQLRAGAEYGHRLPLGRLVASWQIASGGFVGGSLTWDGKQEGRHGLAPLLGIGRTNRKPYVNLNFDPNDSLMLGASFSAPWLGLGMVYQVRDDRLGTGQRVTHAVWRRGFEHGIRATLDVFTRTGSAQAGAPVYRGAGFAATLDVGDFFVRVSHDARANYDEAKLTRLAAGMRF